MALINRVSVCFMQIVMLDFWLRMKKLRSWQRNWRTAEIKYGYYSVTWSLNLNFCLANSSPCGKQCEWTLNNEHKANIRLCMTLKACGMSCHCNAQNINSDQRQIQELLVGYHPSFLPSPYFPLFFSPLSPCPPSLSPLHPWKPYPCPLNPARESGVAL